MIPAIFPGLGYATTTSAWVKSKKTHKPNPIGFVHFPEPVKRRAVRRKPKKKTRRRR